MAKKQIGEHIIDIPDWKPGMELLNQGLPYNECYWKRVKFPKLFYDVTEETVQFSFLGTKYDENGKLITVSNEDSLMLQKLVIKDIHRRLNGVHIMIKDKIEWLPPGFYFFLQWFNQLDLPIDSEGFRMGSFRKIQMDILQLWEYVKHNPEIAGLILPKIKKCGITYLFAGDICNMFTIMSSKLFLLMSKDFSTCKLSQFSFIKYGYENLPYLLKPVASKSNETQISLGKPKDKKWQSKTGKYLRSLLVACKTKVAAFDGPVPWICWWDEFPKTWKASHVSVQQTFDKSVEAVKFQQVINGKLLLTSYMPEEYDQGFQEGKDLCEGSLLRTIKEGNLRTETNMIILPIYAHQSNQDCFDKFGDCDQERAMKLTLQERSQKNTAVQIQSHKRQYPLTWNDMFANTGVGSIFDNINLSIHDSDLRDLDKQGIRPYKEGHLRWKNSTYEIGMRPQGYFSEVYFEELTPEEIKNGKVGSFKIFTDLEEIPDLKHLLNRVVREKIKRNGLFCPHKDNIGVLSVDPVDYKVASQVREGSLNASYGGFAFDQSYDSKAQMPISNTPLFEYNFRHEDPDVILEDMIKATLYWGFYAIIENNKGWIFTQFQKHGLRQFLIVRQADNSITPWKDFAEFVGGNRPISTDESMIKAYIRSIQVYLKKPPIIDGEFVFPYYLKLLKSIDLLTQLMDFDSTNTRKFDLAVAFGYWRIGIENLEIWLIHKGLNEEPTGGGLNEKILDRMLG